jgi:hypothetical protein
MPDMQASRGPGSHLDHPEHHLQELHRFHRGAADARTVLAAAVTGSAFAILSFATGCVRRFATRKLAHNRLLQHHRLLWLQRISEQEAAH